MASKKKKTVEAWIVTMTNSCNPEGVSYLDDEKPDLGVGETIYKGSISIVHLVPHTCTEKCK